MLSAFGEPPASGKKQPRVSGGRGDQHSGQGDQKRSQEASVHTTFGHEGREYKERGGPFAPRVTEADGQAPLKLRGPLLHERRHALHEVRRAGHLVLDRRLELELLLHPR